MPSRSLAAKRRAGLPCALLIGAAALHMLWSVHSAPMARCVAGAKGMQAGHKGIELANAGDLATAAACFVQAAKGVSPQEAVGWRVNAGKAFEQLSDLQNAWVHGWKFVFNDKSAKPEIADVARLAANLRGAGRIQESTIVYQRGVKLYHKEVPEFAVNLGVNYMDMGKLDLAIQYYNKALEVRPNFFEARRNLASVLVKAGRSDEARLLLQEGQANDPTRRYDIEEGLLFLDRQPAIAKEIFSRSLETNRNDALALYNLGLAEFFLGNLKTAEETQRRAISIDPTMSLAHYGLGNALERQGRYPEALEAFRQSSELSPNMADVYFNMGTVLQNMKKHSEALEVMSKCLEIDPNQGSAYINMGVSLKALHRVEEAVEVYKKGIAAGAPAQAYGNLASALHEMGRDREAIQWAQKAVEKDPNYAHGYSTLGSMYRPLGKMEEAKQAFRTALSLVPDYSEAALNLAGVLVEDEKFEEALSVATMGLRMSPHDTRLAVEVFNLKRRVAEWKNWDVQIQALETVVEEQMRDPLMPKLSIQPFQSTTYPLNNDLDLRVAKHFANGAQRRAGLLLKGQLKHPYDMSFQASRIKVGFISSDFRRHPMAYLFQSMFGMIDRNSVHAFCFMTFFNDKSSFRAKIEQEVESFVDLYGKQDNEMAIEINAHQVHVLVDFNGWVANHKQEIMALKTAPVQLLPGVAYFGTSGGDYMDGFVTDRIVSSVDISPGLHLEKLVMLPGTYQINDHFQTHKYILNKDPTPRAELGISSKSTFVFANFNSFQKIEPKLFVTWTRIMKRVPGASLLLLENPLDGAKNIRKMWRQAGLEDERLVLGPLTGPEANLLRMKACDLHLDTLLYNGHTTSSDALWCGVPVLTLPGERSPSRVASSFMRWIDPTMIATNLQDYEDMAVKFATSQSLAQEAKKRVVAGRESSPLFKTEQWTKDFIKSIKLAFETKTSSNTGMMHLSLAERSETALK